MQRSAAEGLDLGHVVVDVAVHDLLGTVLTQGQQTMHPSRLPADCRLRDFKTDLCSPVLFVLVAAPPRVWAGPCLVGVVVAIEAVVVGVGLLGGQQA